MVYIDQTKVQFATVVVNCGNLYSVVPIYARAQQALGDQI